jgi:phenylpyruvate tautomerase PptA (4-oxalocrotonate tautomerase family)
MPCIDVVMPETDKKTLEKLARNLTRAFAESTGFPAELLGIRFDLYKKGQVSLGGELWTNDNQVPFLHIVVHGPRWKRSVKQLLVKTMTKGFTDALEKEEWIPVLHITEAPYDNIGVQGELLSNTYKECAEADFYYQLPDD